MEIRYELSKNLKEKPTDETKLGFGHVFTDHMFIMDYDTGMGWHDARIVPYGNIELSPAAMCLHYGQEIFEGLKAYRTADGKIQLFRPDMNAKRTNNTNKRMCMPQIDEDLFVDAVKAIVEVDKDWIPDKKDTSLYIRPFMFATEPFLGVAASKTYRFMIILSPVGPYYEHGLAPTRIYVKDAMAAISAYIFSVPGAGGFPAFAGRWRYSV